MKHWAQIWNLHDIDATYDAHEIVVTDDRIAISWTEESETFHAKLTSSDGINYAGTYRCEEVQESQVRRIELARVIKNGTTFLVGYYEEDGTNGYLVLQVEDGAYDDS